MKASGTGGGGRTHAVHLRSCQCTCAAAWLACQARLPCQQGACRWTGGSSRAGSARGARTLHRPGEVGLHDDGGVIHASCLEGALHAQQRLDGGGKLRAGGRACMHRGRGGVGRARGGSTLGARARPPPPPPPLCWLWLWPRPHVDVRHEGVRLLGRGPQLGVGEHQRDTGRLLVPAGRGRGSKAAAPAVRAGGRALTGGWQARGGPTGTLALLGAPLSAPLVITPN